MSFSTIRRLPQSKFYQQPTNPRVAFYIKRKSLVYLVDYAVYQLCMKQLHTKALGLGWKQNGWIPTTVPPSILFPCPFINPGGWPFVFANICLAVCLFTQPLSEQKTFFFYLLQDSSAPCDSLYRDFYLS